LISAVASLVAPKRAIFVHVEQKLTLKAFVKRAFNWFNGAFLEHPSVT